MLNIQSNEFATKGVTAARNGTSFLHFSAIWWINRSVMQLFGKCRDMNWWVNMFLYFGTLCFIRKKTENVLVICFQIPDFCFFVLYVLNV